MNTNAEEFFDAVGTVANTLGKMPLWEAEELFKDIDRYRRLTSPATPTDFKALCMLLAERRG